MPLFKCAQCGYLENTALGDYWHDPAERPALCSQCSTGTWHGEFQRRTPEEAGYVPQGDVPGGCVDFYGPPGGWPSPEVDGRTKRRRK